MSSVEERIRRTPGLEKIETLVDVEDPNRFVVLTQVRLAPSREELALLNRTRVN